MQSLRIQEIYRGIDERNQAIIRCMFADGDVFAGIEIKADTMVRANIVKEILQSRTALQVSK